MQAKATNIAVLVLIILHRYSMSHHVTNLFKLVSQRYFAEHNRGMGTTSSLSFLLRLLCGRAETRDVVLTKKV